MQNTGMKLFNLRGFVILTAAVSGLGLPITGLANHLHQMDSILSPARHVWMSAHTLLGVLFMVSIVWHTILNRRILLNYVRGRAAHQVVGREAVGAVLVVAVMLLVAVGHAFH